ncbi:MULTISPECIES: hypothetical protein [unclassified Paenibacillus]|uniref:hypothetical protein n=1 Tax=unclassified Paenibacillus TaxID=185978 RepID=UPI0027D7B159|nr:MULTISPECIES: hypothetical protein [unclassified Paenibacillus]
MGSNGIEKNENQSSYTLCLPEQYARWKAEIDFKYSFTGIFPLWYIQNRKQEQKQFGG